MYRLARLKDKVIGREKLLFGKEARAKQGGRHPPHQKNEIYYVIYKPQDICIPNCHARCVET